MEIGGVLGWATVAAMASFLGVCAWAYGAGNRTRFEEDAQLPFLDERHDQASQDDVRGERA